MNKLHYASLLLESINELTNLLQKRFDNERNLYIGYDSNTLFIALSRLEVMKKNTEYLIQLIRMNQNHSFVPLLKSLIKGDMGMLSIIMSDSSMFPFIFHTATIQANLSNI